MAEYLSSVVPGLGPSGAMAEDSSAPDAWQRHLEAAFGARLGDLGAADLPPAVVPQPPRGPHRSNQDLQRPISAGEPNMRRLRPVLAGCAAAPHDQPGCWSCFVWQCPQCNGCVFQPTNGHMPGWLAVREQQLVNGGTHQQPPAAAVRQAAPRAEQRQPEGTPDATPVGTKRKFWPGLNGVPSPPEEFVSPLFSTPGDQLDRHGWPDAGSAT